MSKIASKKRSRNGGSASVLRRFRVFPKDERGSMTVESVIILPLLFSALMALYTYYDAYRKQSLALRANYAISDYLSRVYKYDAATMAGLDMLLSYMSKTDKKSWLRVSVVHCAVEAAQCNNPADRKLTYMKSDSAVSANDGITRYATNADMIKALGAKVPDMYKGEYLFVLETSANYRPIFPGSWTGIYATGFVQTVVTKSREFDFLCFENSSKTCVDPSVSVSGST